MGRASVSLDRTTKQFLLRAGMDPYATYAANNAFTRVPVDKPWAPNLVRPMIMATGSQREQERMTPGLILPRPVNAIQTPGTFSNPLGIAPAIFPDPSQSGAFFGPAIGKPSDNYARMCALQRQLRSTAPQQGPATAAVAEHVNGSEESGGAVAGGGIVLTGTRQRRKALYAEMHVLQLKQAHADPEDKEGYEPVIERVRQKIQDTEKELEELERSDRSLDYTRPTAVMADYNAIQKEIKSYADVDLKHLTDDEYASIVDRLTSLKAAADGLHKRLTNMDVKRMTDDEYNAFTDHHERRMREEGGDSAPSGAGLKRARDSDPDGGSFWEHAKNAYKTVSGIAHPVLSAASFVPGPVGLAARGAKMGLGLVDAGVSLAGGAVAGGALPAPKDGDAGLSGATQAADSTDLDPKIRHPSRPTFDPVAEQSEVQAKEHATWQEYVEEQALKAASAAHAQAMNTPMVTAPTTAPAGGQGCLLYTSDAADDM
jgi:hypothetical protein